MDSGSAKEKTLVNLAWEVDDLSRLSQSGRHLLVELGTVSDLLEDASTNLVQINVARRLTQLRQTLLTFVKGIINICMCNVCTLCIV